MRTTSSSNKQRPRQQQQHRLTQPDQIGHCSCLCCLLTLLWFQGTTINEAFTTSPVERAAMAYVQELFKLAGTDPVVSLRGMSMGWGRLCMYYMYCSTSTVATGVSRKCYGSDCSDGL